MNYQKTNRNPLNNSKSKQLYSFTKAQRFNYKNTPVCSQSFYDPHDAYEKKKLSTTFGFGEKADFTKLSTPTPGPNAYHTEGRMQSSQSFCKSTCFMGSGRVYPKVKEVVPSPGSYHIPSSFRKQGYTMRPKYEEKIQNGVPGPGTYRLIDKQTTSSSSVIIGTSKRYSKSPDPIPGPQFYKPKTDLSPTGQYSVYSSNLVASFPKEPRFHTVYIETPGPGQYFIPSEFGFY